MAKRPVVKYKLEKEKNAIAPTHAFENDAGYDLYAPRDVYVLGQMRTTVDTGVCFEIPKGYYGAIKPKSGLLFKEDINVGEGVVDCGYTGSVRVRILNLGCSPYQFKKGEKIAQIVFSPCLTPVLEETTELGETERGSGGFGSTGR
jgi:dUTP pyrophosphatase